MKLRTKIAIAVLLFVAAGMWAISAFGGMPPVYGEKMLRNILTGKDFSEQEINNILSLPRLPDIDLQTETITMRPGKQLWVKEDMSIAIIFDVSGNCCKVSRTLFDRRGEK